MTKERSEAGNPALEDVRHEPQDLEERVKFWRARSDKFAAIYGELEQKLRASYSPRLP